MELYLGAMIALWALSALVWIRRHPARESTVLLVGRGTTWRVLPSAIVNRSVVSVTRLRTAPFELTVELVDPALRGTLVMRVPTDDESRTVRAVQLFGPEVGTSAAVVEPILRPLFASAIEIVAARLRESEWTSERERFEREVIAQLALDDFGLVCDRVSIEPQTRPVSGLSEGPFR